MFLTHGAALGMGTAAGCLNPFDSDVGAVPEPSVVEDRPDAVYYPTHTEEMEMIGVAEAGNYSIGLMYSYPHRFWTVTGTTTERVDIRDDDTIHLMAVVWDAETETVLPVAAGLSMTISRDGEAVEERSPWLMISQRMGFHYGDNVGLDGDGSYTVTVQVNPIADRQLGAYDGTFDSTETAEINFEYSASDRDSLSYTTFEDRQGDRGALDPMDMQMVPTSRLPAAVDLPGELLHTTTSGDAEFVVTVVEEASFLDEEGKYLLISPRTPYNQIPLPLMSLAGRIDRDGDIVFEDEFRAAIHPESGYHYGAVVESLETGDTLTILVRAPSQVSRHEGYETAFLDMEDIRIDIR